MRKLFKIALKLFDQSNLNNCNYIINYVININIFLEVSDIFFYPNSLHSLATHTRGFVYLEGEAEDQHTR